MAEYEDQYAAALNFLIRFNARRGGFDRDAHGEPRARGSARAWVEEAFAATPPRQPRDRPGLHQAVPAERSRPANAGLVAAAIRDTREVWASHFLPGDRARVISVCSLTLPGVCPMRRRGPISPAFMAALQAVN